MKNKAIAVLCLSLVSAGTSCLSADKEAMDGYQDEIKKIVLIPDGENTAEAAEVFSPSVIKDDGEKDYSYRMWYSGCSGSKNNLFNEILYAFSKDGKKWMRRYPTNPVIKFGKIGEFDCKRANSPCVIRDGNLLKMWYTGWDGTYLNGQIAGEKIGYAESMDGREWVKKGVRLNPGKKEDPDSVSARCPAVIKSSNNYIMLYEGDDGRKSRILVALSKDGITWEKKGIALEINEAAINMAHPVVFKKDKLHLWVNIKRDKEEYIQQFISDDGIKWQSDKAVDLDIRDQGKVWTPGAGNLYVSTVIPDGKKLKIWFTARAKQTVGSYLKDLQGQNTYLDALVICYQEEVKYR